MNAPLLLLGRLGTSYGEGDARLWGVAAAAAVAGMLLTFRLLYGLARRGREPRVGSR